MKPVDAIRWLAPLLFGVLLVPLRAQTASAPAASGEEEVPELPAVIVTTGTRTPHRLDESPVRTELLTARDFRLTGGRSLADAVELLPGVRVENNCQNCGTSDILMLGLEGKYTSLLFDGLPLHSGLAAVYGLDQIPAVFLERLEVIKGGGSAAYGSGAVGGVVNIIGRTPVRSGATVEFRHDWVKGRPTMELSASADHVTPGGDRALTLYGQVARTAPVDLNGDGFSDLTRRELRVAGLRLVRATAAGQLRVDYNRTREFRRGGNKFDQPDPLADISERVDTVRQAGSVRWTAAVTPDFDYQLSAAAARIDRETFYGGLFGRGADEPLSPESAPGAGDNDQAFLDRGYATHGQVARDQFGFTNNRLHNLEAQFNLHRDRHRVSLGAQYRHESIEDVVPVSSFVAGHPAPVDRARGESLGLFLQDDWQPSEHWQLLAGLRADQDSELARPVWSPRLNLKWTPSPALTLRATWATGFRAPQPFDEDLHIELVAGARARTVQAADLREERSTSAMFGAIWNPPAAHGRLTLEANAFLTRLRGTFTNSEIRVDPATGEAVRTRFNGPDAEVAGLELNLGALPARGLRLDAGWVAQIARYREPVVLFADGAGAVVAERDFLETPRHYAVAQATWTWRQDTDLVLGAVYTGAMKAVNLRTGWLNPRTESFLVWNATLARTFRPGGDRALTITLGVKNLFDARQGDLERGVDRDPYYFYGPRTPRTLFAGMRVEL